MRHQFVSNTKMTRLILMTSYKLWCLIPPHLLKRYLSIYLRICTLWMFRISFFSCFLVFFVLFSSIFRLNSIQNILERIQKIYYFHSSFESIKSFRIAIWIPTIYRQVGTYPKSRCFEGDIRSFDLHRDRISVEPA